MAEAFHFISCSARCVLSRRSYVDVSEVESEFPDLVSWVGPLSASELAEEVETSFVPPGTGPFTRSDVVAFIHSREEQVEARWPE